MSSKQRNEERAAKLAAMRAEQQRKDRRSKILIFGTTGAVVLGLAAATAIPLINQAERQKELEAAANAPIEGVEEFTDLSSNHVEGTVDYATTPPVGGDHNTVWQNCGVYTEPVTDENVVHSLEHGAVWIAYSPDLSTDDVAILTDKAKGEAYALVSPYEALDASVTLSAWGLQLKVDDPADPRIDAFLERYLQGEQTLEPGAACSGGVGTPAA
ncbi:DUF3105 domain-containing protein [Georgenia daeguensis]|uniref:DUF3105 domain-containing protein n=1 Tax=Georgenia daeguensis TaxID=908355 RepID=A0ABP8EZ64_9MICO